MDQQRHDARHRPPLIVPILLLAALSASAPAYAADPCGFNAGERVELGVIREPHINEVSGIAASRRNPGVYLIHNDSGDRNRIFAIGGDARLLGTFYIEGFAERDWEDIAVGPGPEDGVSYVYVGNIGDNDGVFPLKHIARFPEPAVDPEGMAITSRVAGADIISFEYPDGMRDAETLMVDPLTKDIYVVSKRESDVRVYRAPFPQPVGRTVALEHVATLTNVSWAVAGDIALSGGGILLKTLDEILLWCRQPGQSVAGAMAARPRAMSYVLGKKDEAICWQADEHGYLVIGEGRNPALFLYPEQTVD